MKDYVVLTENESGEIVHGWTGARFVELPKFGAIANVRECKKYSTYDEADALLRSQLCKNPVGTGIIIRELNHS